MLTCPTRASSQAQNRRLLTCPGKDQLQKKWFLNWPHAIACARCFTGWQAEASADFAASEALKLKPCVSYSEVWTFAAMESSHTYALQVRQGRAGQGRAGQGRAGQSRAGQGRTKPVGSDGHAVLHGRQKKSNAPASIGGAH